MTSRLWIFLCCFVLSFQSVTRADDDGESSQNWPELLGSDDLRTVQNTLVSIAKNPNALVEYQANLLGLLKHDDFNVRGLAVRALGRMPGKSDELLSVFAECLGDSAYNVRHNASVVLFRESEKGLKVVAKAFSDPKNTLLHRLQASTLLAPKSAVPLKEIESLILALKDTELADKEMILIALNVVDGAPESFSDLTTIMTPWLDYSDFNVQMRTASVMVKMKSARKDLTAKMLEWLSEEEEYQKAAIHTLGLIQKPGEVIIPALLNQCDNPSFEISALSVSSLTRFDAEELCPYLEDYLLSEARPGVRHALTLLTKCSSPSKQLISRLKHFLQNDDWRIQRAALVVLNIFEVKDDELTAAVQDLILDGNELISMQAKQLLERIQSTPSSEGR